VELTGLKIFLAAVIIILGIAAVKTVIPNSNASKPCLLGYKATCSFVPISTVILILVAIAVFVAAKRIIVE